MNVLKTRGIPTLANAHRPFTKRGYNPTLSAIILSVSKTLIRYNGTSPGNRPFVRNVNCPGAKIIKTDGLSRPIVLFVQR
jgi:hypothetical protein